MTFPITLRSQKQELSYLKKFVNVYSKVLKCATHKKLLVIARLFTSKMTHLRPSLSEEFEPHVSFKHSLILSLFSFAGSMLLDIFVLSLFHLNKHRHRPTPLWCGFFALRNVKQQNATAAKNQPQDIGMPSGQ